ncbi:ATP-binding cassette domain-containing protein [Portibacter marinus]|uniref:ATP-binding cassette domain-containing protein n=1 Tax=Portibacter marinus TaxID=2898660 RepID=UPI001F206BE0|nr:ATP-binding cassette domain-containing protein [Portibacter marinus]
MLEIQDIKKSFGNKDVLKGISLQFLPGYIYGIAGENGAGKTTLFRCISGLEISEGAIYSPYDILKNHIGLLPTNPKIISRITGWEYLKLLALARSVKEDDFEDQNIFDLPLNEFAEHYSTGMKKKLALMAILLQKNDIYILDEPFNGVDIQSNMVIQSILQKLKALGKTVLISSHIFSTLRESCDFIHLLREGEIKMSSDKSNFTTIEREMIKGSTTNKLNLLRLT